MKLDCDVGFKAGRTPSIRISSGEISTIVSMAGGGEVISAAGTVAVADRVRRLKTILQKSRQHMGIDSAREADHQHPFTVPERVISCSNWFKAKGYPGDGGGHRSIVEYRHSLSADLVVDAE